MNTNTILLKSVNKNKMPLGIYLLICSMYRSVSNLPPAKMETVMPAQHRLRLKSSHSLP